MRSTRKLLVAINLIFLPSVALATVNSDVFIGKNIPKFIRTHSRIIFSDSDSLYLNGRLLLRGSEYRFDQAVGGFDLSILNFALTDTLVVKYRTAPRWLSTSFSQTTPEISNNGSVVTQSLLPITLPKRLQQSPLTDISISGAKTFRFTSQTAGNSEFGQSLDLNIEGNLNSDLKISGTISDRGFNPSYGTSNSRLEELDKVNLRLESRTFNTQVGNIVLGRRLFQENALEKQVSGASFNFHSNNFGFNGVAARPKGRFETFSFTGNDRIQGPYQITENGSTVGIVPNSESVWLDGRKLTRGPDNDYTMDYPTGRITFSVRNLIDRRSRIEIDFEPIISDFASDLFSTGAEYQVGDSAFYAAIEWFREGDVKSRPQLGEFTVSDNLLLQSVGDNEETAFRSGASIDTNGSYIINADSLPDTVYQFVGDDNGTHSVSFSFVGNSKGEYKFAGGNNYFYVGIGNGDYLPIIKLSLPERTEFYTTKLGINNEIFGSLRADISVSRYDKNLLSSLDDSDNEGVLLNLTGQRTFTTNNNESVFNLRLRNKNADFNTRFRINDVDFSRNYLTPFAASFNSEERLLESDSRLAPLKNLFIRPFYGRLEYKNNFKSNNIGVESKIGESDKFSAGIYWSETEADLLSGAKGSGYAANKRVNAAAPLFESVRLSAEFERDHRHSDYHDLSQGIRFARYASALERVSEKITYEHYAEDTLINSWSESMKRNRVGGSSVRRFGDFNFNTYFGYQWILRPDGRAESFINRTILQYNNIRKQISVSAGYTMSEETRNARGITYLEVEPGQGNFTYENGRYFPDPNGNYIQIEELLSDQSKIDRGEKSFQFSKNWSFVQARFNSEIREELLDGGQRHIWWLVPFLSDENQPYLIYNRNYNSEIRIAPIKGGHVVSFSLDERVEIRNLAGTPRGRTDRTGSIALKQVIKTFFIEEHLKLFSSIRDDYYIGAGEVDGYNVGGSVRKPVKSSEFSVGVSFRRAKSLINEESKTISTSADSRVRIVEKGDLRNSIEFYSQQYSNVTGFPSYILTDNKPGTKGAIWSTGFNYNVRKGMRINFNLSGRHSNETSARLFGRTEVVAEF